MKSIAQFIITKEDKGYSAEGVDIAIVTQADTLDELAHNIREAVSLHLEGEDLSSLGFNREPTLLMNVELPQVPGYA